MKKIIVLATLIASLIQSPLSSANPVDCESSLALYRDHPLVQQLAPLEQTADGERAYAERLAQATERFRKLVEELKSALNFRERHLWKWAATTLGGDPGKIQTFTAKQEEFDRLDAQMNAAFQKLLKSDLDVLYVIESWLTSNNDYFQKQSTEKRRLFDLVCSGQRCLKQLDATIDIVKAARRTDLAAGVTDNKVFEFMAVSKTAAANKQVTSAQEAVQNYQDALLSQIADRTTGLSLQGLKAVNYGVQFAIDLVTNTGWMDVYNAFQLGKTLERLSGVREKIVAIHREIESTHDQLAARLNSEYCAIRSQCRAFYR